MVKYCIGVDVLGFPVYVIHYIGETSVSSTSTNKEGKKFGFIRSLKHRNMKNK